MPKQNNVGEQRIPFAEQKQNNSNTLTVKLITEKGQLFTPQVSNAILF